MAGYPAPPTWISFGTFSGTTTTLTANLANTWTDDDILVQFVETANEAVTTPTGWNLIGAPGTGAAAGLSSTRVSAYWRRAVAGDTAPVFADAGDHMLSICHAIRGCVTTGDPVDSFATGTATSASAIEITTPVTSTPNCMVLYCATTSTDSATFQFTRWGHGDVDLWVSRSGNGNAAQGNGGGIWVSSGVLPRAGEQYGPTCADTIATVDAVAMIAIAFMPVGAPPGSGLVVA